MINPVFMVWFRSGGLAVCRPVLELRMPDDPKPQAHKFADLARELECDEDEAAFEDTVRKVAKAPPPPPEKPE